MATSLIEFLHRQVSLVNGKWELPCYITSFLAIVILGVGLNAKPDMTIENWAHQKALKRLEMEKLSLFGSESA